MIRIFGFWTIFIALVISAIAAYYSIIGLIAIFAAAAVPVIIMGTALEIGKITSAIWLHLKWKTGKWLIKGYLVFAVALLMFITSMGIFGFLSKAHVEQNASMLEGQAQLERIEVEITRAEGEITRAEGKIEKLSTADTSTDDGIQEKIRVAELSITTVYDRLKDDVEFTQDSLDQAAAPYLKQAEQADATLEKMNTYAETNNITALQGLVGAAQDGRMGSKTAKLVSEFRDKVEKNRMMTLFQLQKIRENSQDETKDLRDAADRTIAQTNKLINRLREQLGTATDNDVEPKIQELQVKIKDFELNLDTLFEQKYAIEAEGRELEADVGPVKYIAELVYGEEADRDSLEDAVRWVILLLVIVFDPLAIVLVISGISLVEEYPRKKRIRNEDKITETTPKTDLVEKTVKETKARKEPKSPKVTPNQPEPSSDAIEFKGVVYEPTDYAYHRIKDQIDANDKHRKIISNQTKVNNIVERMELDEKTTDVDIVKKRLEQMFEEDNAKAELLTNADTKTIHEVFKDIIKDTKK
tara:strand:- start:14559 stop:16142 length:1584 start_codon:yes stop_codon:yes gene_type:complete